MTFSTIPGNSAAVNQGASSSGRNANGGGNGAYPSSGGVSQSVSALQKISAAQAAAAAAAQSSTLALRLPINNNGSTVLIVSNLNEEVRCLWPAL